MPDLSTLSRRKHNHIESTATIFVRPLFYFPHPHLTARPLFSSQYLGGEICSVCGHTHIPEHDLIQTPSSLPSEIVPGFLFVGSYDHASRIELLKTLGINYVLNLVTTSPNLFKASFNYHNASCSPPNLDECAAFLDQVRAQDGKVLIHCMSGNSKSPSVALYYLMKAYKQPLPQAYLHLKSKRPSVSFKEEDVIRLQEAEVTIFGGASGFTLPIGKSALGATSNMVQQQQALPQQLGGGFGDFHIGSAAPGNGR